MHRLLIAVVTASIAGTAVLATPPFVPTSTATTAAQGGAGNLVVPDPLDLGTALPPVRDVAAVLRRQGAWSPPATGRRPRTGASALPSAVGELGPYARSGFAAVVTPGAPVPYHLATPGTRARPQPSTPAGVPMKYVQGVAYDHPSNQAVWGLQQLESYRLVADKFYLERAKAAAQHLLDTSVTSRKALWFPFRFDFAIHNDKSVLMPAPWYSAMAQGEALSLFTRLWSVTGVEAWHQAAEQTLWSLSLPPMKGQPWVSHIDGSKRLWLEEYPRYPTERSERVLNGSIFAVYGLHDYLRLVPQSARFSASRALALRLYDGGVTTVRAHALATFRAPQWISRYSLLHTYRDVHYQEVHTDQLLQLQHLTGQVWFAAASDTYRADYPTAALPGSIALAAGRHVGYRFDASGKVTASMSRTLPAASGAPNDLRRRIRGHGIYYRITAGAFAGWWVAEAWPTTYQRSITLRHDYFPQRQAKLNRGTWTGYKYSATATVLARTSASYAAATSAPVAASAVIHGQLHLLVSRGRYAGFWLPVTPGVSLR